jgi:4-hydroxy-tetrahydrodipicolinate reductase
MIKSIFMAIGITVMGARGRMGSRVISLAAGDFFVTEWAKADVAIDFSSQLAAKENLAKALASRKPLVMGTTGHTPENHAAIEAASKEIPILFSPNFSLGMVACLEAATLLAKRLDCAIDIVEAHHAQKKDRPSGTALLLARSMGKEVPIHSIRAGDIIGDHTILFTCEGERIELKHHVVSRDAFAQGALKAAKFLVKQPPGLYSVKDIV